VTTASAGRKIRLGRKGKEKSSHLGCQVGQEKKNCLPRTTGRVKSSACSPAWNKKEKQIKTLGGMGGDEGSSSAGVQYQKTVQHLHQMGGGRREGASMP